MSSLKFHFSAKKRKIACLFPINVYNNHRNEFFNIGYRGMRIAFFGGTFDPPHLGHTGLAGQALRHRLTDLVLFVPAWMPPHKPGRAVTPFEQRMEMLERAVAGKPGFAVSDIERRLALSPSYTIDVLAALDREYPADRIQLMIGADSLEQLHSWQDGFRLGAERELIVYPRPGYRPDAARLRRHWPEELIPKLLASQYPLETFDISSTEIRRGASSGEKFDNRMEKSVYEYILEQNLYEMNEDI
jgi:nicotinate-nucleotide adenylyltransferase